MPPPVITVNMETDTNNNSAKSTQMLALTHLLFLIFFLFLKVS